MDFDSILQQNEWVLVGPVLQNPLPSSFLPGLSQVAVDGGVHFAHHPVCVIGDGDSGRAPPELPWIRKTDSNLTDLAFVFQRSRSWRGGVIHLVGFSGLRMDHELANLGESYRFMNDRPQAMLVIYDDQLKPRGRWLSQGFHEFNINGLFSVLAIEPTRVTIRGSCDYTVDHLELLPLSGRGVSNNGTGFVQLEADHPVLLIQEGLL